MTQRHTATTNGLMNAARALLAGVVAIGLVALVFVLAAFLTAAALVAAGVAALGASAWWLYRKLKGPQRQDAPRVLVAHRGPRGWVVDGEEPRRA
ncbi:MAG: hypothetical protein ACOC05_01530 [Oceanicaulis sp.]